MLSQSLLITIGLIAAVFLITVYSFANNSMFLMYFMVAIPPMVFLVNRVDILLMATLVLFYSTVTLPVFPQNFNMFYMLAFFFIMVMVANRIIRKQSKPMDSVCWWLVAFSVVLIATASFRGFGVRVFGGSSWGGAGYIQLAIAIGLYLMARHVPMSPRMWQVSLYGLILLTLLPSAAQLLYVFSGGAIWQQYYFVTPDYSVISLLRGFEQQDDLVRLQSAGWFGYQMWILALMIRRRGFIVNFIRFAIMMAAGVSAGVSGHRLAFILIVTITAVYASLQTWRGWNVIFNRYIIALGVSVVLLATFARHLPMTYQRVLSVIPFANISTEARMNAQGTTGWRVEIWKRMMRQMPKYLIVGKGFAFSPNEIRITSAYIRGDSVEQAIAAHVYHNGPIGFLFDLGLGGLICGSGFILAVIWMQYRRMRAEWMDERLRHLHRVILASYITQALVFFFIFGDPRSSVVQFVVSAVFLDGFSRADDHIKSTKTIPSVQPQALAGVMKPAQSGFRPAPVIRM
jgi:hypothetical protein